MAAFEKIFIVDDDELFLIVTKSIMEDEDFANKIYNFEDGNKALRQLQSIEKKDLPEVLFLDINMPMMDGWEFMSALEELEIDNNFNIYITSSSINPLDLKAAETNPFIKGFISKPIDPGKLEKIIKACKI
ncbi:response regulator [Marivirga sp.]|uniref:response regulator n=1 Tax=Marivirga sp. TaxID=2018662 RepID=UPI002D7F12C4|nr:response regulator [Marivirga sp.]HET8859666.1 response regulator [Marivirga sp.]